MRRPVGLLLILLISTAVHGEAQFTLSVGENTSRADVVAPFPPSTILSSRYSGMGPRISLGMSRSARLAFEVGWSKFGSARGVVRHPGAISPCAPICPGPEPNPPPGPPVFQDTKQSGHSVWLAYTPSWRHGPLELALKLGVAHIERATKVENNPWASRLERDIELLFGGGATHWFTDWVGIRLDGEVLGGNAVQMGLSLTMGF